MVLSVSSGTEQQCGSATDLGGKARLPDRSLIRGCLAGDRRAWERLVRRFERPLYSIGLRCGLSADDAADVFQTVCMRLIQNLDKLKDDEHLTGWVLTTAKHECIHVLRQRNRHEPLEESHLNAGEAAYENAVDSLPQEVLCRLEDEQMVRVAMDEMNERCSRLLKLLYQADPPFPYAEVAKRMNMPVGAVGPTRARCLKRLKENLEKMGF